MKTASIAMLALLGVSLGACAAAVQNKENMLSAAGFNMRPASTPEQIASLKALPPNKFFVKTQNDQPIWFYADPSVCGCLYYGDQDAYQNYRQMVFQQNLANEQEMAAMMNQQAAFDFAPWGDPFYGP